MTHKLLNVTINGYRLVEFISAGGMGEVYKAVHVQLGRIAAVKLLTAVDGDPQFAQRFMNEARIHAGLQHDNIVTLYEFTEFNRTPCIIMEYIDGHTLRERMQHYGQLPISEAFFIFQPVVDAISYMHKKGIVHRDIKPTNIKINSRKTIKLLDFGIASAGHSRRLTEAGNVVGTTHYMSPERLEGDVGGDASDIWSLGVLLYEMVAGTVPFNSLKVDQLYDQILSANYVPASTHNSAVPKEFDLLIDKCLKKKPAARFSNAEELEKTVLECAMAISTPRLIKTAPDHETKTSNFTVAVSKIQQKIKNTFLYLITRPKTLYGIITGVVILILAALLFNLEPNSKFPGIRNPGFVEIHVPNGPAQITVNGKFETTVTVHAPYKLPFIPGKSYTIELRRRGFQTDVFTIRDENYAEKITRTLQKK